METIETKRRFIELQVQCNLSANKKRAKIFDLVTLSESGRGDSPDKNLETLQH